MNDGLCLISDLFLEGLGLMIRGRRVHISEALSRNEATLAASARKNIEKKSIRKNMNLINIGWIDPELKEAKVK